MRRSGVRFPEAAPLSSLRCCSEGSGETVVRAALRVAIKERRNLQQGAPHPVGAPLFEEASTPS